MKHRKHTKLTKPHGGLLHACEMSLFGAPCDVINELAQKLIPLLQPYKVAYADADHKVLEKENFTSNYQDKTTHHQVNFGGQFYIKRAPFLLDDAVITNGNHFNAVNQILLLNSKKEISLSKKLDRLTNVILIIIDDVSEPYDFLSDVIDYNNIPKLKMSQLSEISDFIKTYIESQTPPVHGLILMGGKSERMGVDKAQLDYHGVPQFEHVFGLMKDLGISSSLSVNTLSDAYSTYRQIEDTYIGLGPYSGLLSAFRANPNMAILSCPCDAPLIDKALLVLLLQSRNPNSLATCFYNPETDFPEPLITIWEPKAYPVLLEYLSLGYSCPRKVLINSDITLVELGDAAYKLKNANTIEEKAELIKLIQQ